MAIKTALTGLIQDPSGAPATSGYVEFIIQPKVSSTLFRIQGSSVVAPLVVRAGIGPTGQILDADLVSPFEIWGNDLISPGNTYYQVVIAPNGTVSQRIAGLLISGATYDLSAPVFTTDFSFTPEGVTLHGNPVEGNLLPIAPSRFTVGSATLPYSQGHFDELFADNLTIANAISSISIALVSYLYANLPNNVAIGTLARVTDRANSVWQKTAANTWRRVNKIWADPKLDYGAIGDGVTDDSAALYACMLVEKFVAITDGTYLVDPTLRHLVGTINMPGVIRCISNQTIVMSPGCTIKSKPYVTGDDTSAATFGIYSVSNVRIYGGNLLGNYVIGEAPRVPAGEGQHGINIGNSTNVIVEKVNFQGYYGDGWTVGYIANSAADPTFDNSERVWFVDCNSTLNWRNGASFVGCKIGGVVRGSYTGSIGNGSPEAGIDLEPNIEAIWYLNAGTSKSRVEDILIEGVHIASNNQSGLQILNQYTKRIKVNGCSIINQTHSGVGLFASKAEGLVITNNNFRNGVGANIELLECRQSVVSNNLCQSTDGNCSGILVYGGGGIVSAITKANPGVVTVVDHEYNTGDVVELANVGGMTEVNLQNYTITRIDANSFSIGVNTTGYGAYTAGGVSTLQTKDITISGNTCSEVGLGIQVTTQNVPTLGWPVHNVNVVGNTILTANSIGIDVFGILQSRVGNNNIYNVVNGGIRVSTAQAIQVEGNNIQVVNGVTLACGIYVTTCARAHIVGNNIEDVNHEGIRVVSSAGAVVESNKIYLCVNQGLYLDTCSRILVQGNYIDLVADGGIKCLTCAGGLISGNWIYEVSGTTLAAGIYADSGCAGIGIMGNYIEQPIFEGIDVNGANFVTVDNNHIVLAQRSGIRLNNFSDYSCQGNWILNPSQQTNLGYQGIHLILVDRGNVQGNKVRATTANKPQYSIYMQSGNDNLVTNNYLAFGGTTASLHDTATATVTAAGNVL